MEKADPNNFEGRVFLDSDTNIYNPPIKTSGTKITDSKFININEESKGKKILTNRTLFFYDSGDNKINVVKIKRDKSAFEDHKANIVDFTIPPRSSMEMFSVDEDNICLRWGYKYKESLQAGIVNGLKFEKPMQHILSNSFDNFRVLAAWSKKNIALTYYWLSQQNKQEQFAYYIPTEDFMKTNNDPAK